MVVSNVPSLACRLLSNLLPLMKPRWPPVKVKIGDCEQSYCKTSQILNSMHERRWFFSKNFWKKPISQPEKTADISRRHHCFPREMTSQKRVQKVHSDDASLPRSGWCFWLVEANFRRGTTNQKNYPDLGCDESSVWNFSDVIWRGKQR